MAAPVIPSLIVNELLNKHNYDDWSFRVETYLVAKGLWSVVKDAADPLLIKGKYKREAWEKTNAEALHTIHLCCGNDAFKVIRYEKKAYKAWDALIRFDGSGNTTDSESTKEFGEKEDIETEKKKKKKNENEVEKEATEGFTTDTESTKQLEEKKDVEAAENEPEKEATEGNLQSDHDARAEEAVREADKPVEVVEGGDRDGHNRSNDNTGVVVDYKYFFRAAKDHKWGFVMEFIKEHPEAVTKPAPKDDEKTVLHYAVEDMRVDIVRQLMPLIKDEYELDRWDSEDYTALEYCYVLPDKDETVEIAKCLVEKKKELNISAFEDGYDYDYPVLLLETFMKGRTKLANYLFKVGKFETKDPLAAQLISLSFSTKRLTDIAFKLIKRNPNLAIAEQYFSENSPLNELACTPSAFFSGSRLKFWEKWIYHAISVKSTVDSEEGPTITMDKEVDVPTEANGKGKPTPKPDAIPGDVLQDEDGKGKPTHATHVVTIGDAPTSNEDDKDKKNGLICSGYFKSFCPHVWIWNVTVMFQGSIIQKICKIFGISHIYEMKVNHSRSRKILDCMCEVLTTEKMKDWNQQQTKFVDAAMFQAAERGLVEFLTAIFKVNPNLAKRKNKKGKNLFQVAVECRQAEVFNLIHGLNKDNRKAYMSMMDDDYNNMLHMMGISSPSSQTNRIRGAALQMQYELQWLKELESMASPEDLEAKNDTHDMTPREFFSESHTEMGREGEKSMKDTATSCTVVGALIVTMMFAAAFTLPKPLEDNSNPPLLYRRAFRVFIIADAISLFTSTTSVVLFLGILTSRYAQDDFLRSLPRKMILGLLTLFLSVAAMVIVFASALYIILPSDTRIALPTTLLAGIPIASFIWMQFPFLVEIFYLTYMRKLLVKKGQVMKLNIGKVRRLE